MGESFARRRKGGGRIDDANSVVGRTIETELLHVVHFDSAGRMWEREMRERDEGGERERERERTHEREKAKIGDADGREMEQTIDEHPG